MAALAVALILLTPFFTGVMRGYTQNLFDMMIQVGSRP
jgi:flagellar biosynthesis protein FliQ